MQLASWSHLIKHLSIVSFSYFGRFVVSQIFLGPWEVHLFILNRPGSKVAMFHSLYHQTSCCHQLVAKLPHETQTHPFETQHLTASLWIL